MHSLSNIQGCEAQLATTSMEFRQNQEERVGSTDEEVQLECQFYASSS